jgi:hypothetical protein
MRESLGGPLPPARIKVKKIGRIKKNSHSDLDEKRTRVSFKVMASIFRKAVSLWIVYFIFYIMWGAKPTFYRKIETQSQIQYMEVGYDF